MCERGSTVGSIQCRRPKTKAAILVEGGVEAVGFLIGERTVFLSPLGEELLQLAYTVSTRRVELGSRPLSQWFDAHGLAVLQRNVDIEDDDAVLHVPEVRCRRRRF